MTSPPTEPARPTYEEYPEWLSAELGAAIGQREQTHYETASQLIQQQTLQSSFWQTLVHDMPDAASEYLLRTGFPLLATGSQLSLDRKRWESFALKTYRKNIKDNPGWPQPPEGGWVVFPDWYNQVGDIVRTLIVVRYLDGMAFLAERIEDIATQAGLEVDVDRVARDEGYYATHVNVYGKAIVPGIEWDDLEVTASLEIQVTTQLQDNIRQLLHTTYETARASEPAVDWRWDYETTAFRTNYLGHVLHYVEGMVMSVREQGDGDNQAR